MDFEVKTFGANLIKPPKQLKSQLATLYRNSFTNAANESEGKMVGRLVEDILTTDTDWICHSALLDNTIIGAIFWTRLHTCTDLSTFLLSPVATCPTHQGKKVAQKLIGYGLDNLKSSNVALVLTYGDLDYYSKLGFCRCDTSHIIPPYPLSMPNAWLAQTLTDTPLADIQPTKTSCVAPFCNPSIW